MEEYRIGVLPKLPTETENCKLTSIRISSYIGWFKGEEKETEQHLTIAVDGRVWFTARNNFIKYNVAEGAIPSNIVRTERRNIGKIKARELLDMSKKVFADNFSDEWDVCDALPDDIVFRYSDGTKIHLSCFADEKIGELYKRIDEAVLIEGLFLYCDWDKDDTDETEDSTKLPTSEEFAKLPEEEQQRIVEELFDSMTPEKRQAYLDSLPALPKDKKDF